MSGVQYIEVDSDIVEQRIDNFLISKFSGLPKSLIYRWIRKGELRVNKKRVKQTDKVTSGDIIRVPPFILETEESVVKIPSQHLDFLENRILYETDDYIIVDKPSGMAVHGGSGINSGLVERLRQLRPKVKRLDLVHRLDKETSGCIILAKKHSSVVYFFDLFKQRKVDKIYFAVVHGLWDKNMNKIDLPLSRTLSKSGERIVKVDYTDGKKAITNILNVTYIGKKYSLLEIRLETGRTHQIRVHCQVSGHPIVFDKKYGNSEKDKDLSGLNIDKLLLHAYSLEFFDSKKNEKVNVKADLDSRIKKILDL